MKKHIIALSLLATATLASAVTITIHNDTPSLLDFSVEWGQTIGEYGTHVHGSDGSEIYWLAQVNRNPNFYFIEIHDANFPDLHGFPIMFWGDPEYVGPVPTEFDSPNVRMMSSDCQVLPLDSTPYGARWIYRTPDSGETLMMMVLSIAWLATVLAARRTE